MDHSQPKTPPGAPLSHAISLKDIEKTDRYTFEITPDNTELASLAAFLGALKIAKFSFRGKACFIEDNTVLVEADIGATVTQTCVVTLRPVKTRIDDRVERRYSGTVQPTAEDRQMLPEEDENLEALTDPIDFGAIATEAIALALPAYPRSADADLEQASFAAPGVTPLSDADLKPFASLAELQKKLKENR